MGRCPTTHEEREHGSAFARVRGRSRPLGAKVEIRPERPLTSSPVSPSIVVSNRGEAAAQSAEATLSLDLCQKRKCQSVFLSYPFTHSYRCKGPVTLATVTGDSNCSTNGAGFVHSATQPFSIPNHEGCINTHSASRKNTSTASSQAGGCITTATT